MAPMACVDLPAFPLQILLRRHPEWRELPAAVVAEDRPQALLLWVNERARGVRILPGMRYAAGLSLSRELRAGVVSATDIEEEIGTLMNRLRFFSPSLECAREDPGSFWLGAEGLSLLHPSLRRWGEMIRDDLRGAGYEAAVAVGFSRFGSYAAARAAAGGVAAQAARASKKNPSEKTASETAVDAASDVIVFRDSAEERAAVRAIPIDRIACAPEFRDTLARLGIRRLGGFIDLPPAGIRRRFGEEAFRLHRLAAGDADTPLTSEAEVVPYEARVVFDRPETDTARLVDAIRGVLAGFLRRFAEEDRALAGLILELTYDRPGPSGERGRSERIRPARPTCDVELLLDLLRLRCEAVRLPSGVADLKITLEAVPGSAEQIGLFFERPRRDPEAGNRALARLKAEFGENAVCAARPREAHLPEARFALTPIERLEEAKPRRVRTPPLVRRILLRPEPLGWSGIRVDPYGLRLPREGTIEEAAGPFLVSGGWWRKEVERHYWYARTSDGAWLWIYRDPRRRRWFRQGEVE